MNDHINCSKCPPLADTRFYLQSLAVVFHIVVNGFLRWQTKSTEVYFKLRNCFWLLLQLKTSA